MNYFFFIGCKIFYSSGGCGPSHMTLHTSNFVLQQIQVRTYHMSTQIAMPLLLFIQIFKKCIMLELILLNGNEFAVVS